MSVALSGWVEDTAGDLVRQALAKREVRDWLERQGRSTADLIWEAAVPRILHRFRYAAGFATEAGPPGQRPPAWVEQIVAPVLDPFARGAGDRLKERARPLLVGLGVGAGVLLLAAFGIGYAVGKRRRRGA